MLKASVPPEKVFGIELRLRRTVDTVTGVAHGWQNIPGWESAWVDFPVRQVLQNELPYPHVMVDDIVRALGVAEGNYGAGHPDDDFVYVLADTGIGMAIMLNGSPYIGFSLSPVKLAIYMYRVKTIHVTVAAQAAWKTTSPPLRS